MKWKIRRLQGAQCMKLSRSLIMIGSMCTEAEKTFEKLLGAYQMLTRRPELEE